jgi:DNA repair protein RecO (recombination protein O)
MLIKTKGIVFRTLKYSETSVIADIYTEECGLMSYIISGVRKKNARTKASLLQLMSIVDLVAYHSDRRKLHRIKELKASYVYQSIPFEVKKGAICLFLAVLSSKSIKETEPNPQLFEFITAELEKLDSLTSGYANLHIEYMIGLAKLMGFGIEGNFHSSHQFFDLQNGKFVELLPDHIYFLDNVEILGRCLSSTMLEVKLTRNQRNEIVGDLQKYYRLHVENFPNLQSHEILHEVL